MIIIFIFNIRVLSTVPVAETSSLPR